jgi:hypothetical protein
VLSNWLYVVLGKNISYDFCVVILNATGNICYCRMKSVKRQVNDCSVIYRGETRSFLEYHDAWFVLKQHANLDYSTNSLKQQFAGRHIFIAYSTGVHLVQSKVLVELVSCVSSFCPILSSGWGGFFPEYLHVEYISLRWYDIPEFVTLIMTSLIEGCR